MEIISKEITQNSNTEKALYLYFEEEECWEALQDETFDDVESGTTIYFIRSGNNEIEQTRHIG